MTETEQSSFWRGEFGDAYVQRNPLDEQAIRNRLAMWSRILASTSRAPPKSILEVGANIGLNAAALSKLTGSELFAVEPNSGARKALASSGCIKPSNVHDGIGDSLPFESNCVDLVFTCTVLIHVAPERLEATCREIYRVSRRYIGCIEYFAATPEEKLYRGFAEKLFKRDFGGYWLDLYPNLVPVDYGFFWKRVSGLDDFTWWLFEKN